MTPSTLGVVASHRSAGPWFPTDVAGLQMWFDADDPATITASAGLVSQWSDKSTNARHAIQAGAPKPSTGTRTINGRNTIEFIPATVSLLNVTVPVIAQPYTFAIAAQYDNVDTGTRYMISTAPAVRTQAGNWALQAGGTLLTDGADDGIAHVFVAVFNGATSGLWIDGISKASGNPGTGATATVITISRTPTGNTWDGPIGEVFMYNSALSTTNRQNAEAYLRAKWGTP